MTPGPVRSADWAASQKGPGQLIRVAIHGSGLRRRGSALRSRAEREPVIFAGLSRHDAADLSLEIWPGCVRYEVQPSGEYLSRGGSFAWCPARTAVRPGINDVISGSVVAARLLLASCARLCRDPDSLA